MKKNYTLSQRIDAIFSILTLCFIFLLVGCASNNIEVQNFDGFYEINEDEQALIQWEFNNSDRVYVSGLEQVFEPKDWVYVKPKESKKYHITAYQGNVDSLQLTAWVEVKKSRPQTPIRGDEENPVKNETIESDLSSTTKAIYLKGLSKVDRSEPHLLRITKTIKDYNDESNYKVQAIIIDKDGNFVSAYSKHPQSFLVNYTVQCDETSVNKNITSIKEADEINTKTIDIALTIDNSASATNFQIPVKYLSQFVKNLSTEDFISLSFFNQNYDKAFSLLQADKAIWEMSNMHIPNTSGLNASFKSAYKSIQELKKGNGDDKLLILVCYNSDNSSIIFTANDVVELAMNSKIPIYTIGVGNAINSNNLKYISSITGGRYYNLSEDNLSEIVDILTEIVYSQRKYYEFDFQTFIDPNNCRIINAELNFEVDESLLTDHFKLIPNKIEQYSQYQAVAAFDYKQAILSNEYNETIESLSRILKDNPSMNIELIGYSENEGSEKFNKVISIERANSVKDAIASNNIEINRISVKGIGNVKPIYYLEQYDWQKYYNRRVEIRWLDPSLLPYELVAELVKTEDEAIRKIEQWEKRGYKSYYERYLYESIPYYRIKIWGFPTYNEAKSEAEKLGKKYKMNFYID